MYNKKYLSKRPFMVITCKFVPARGAQTQLPGWTDTKGWDVVEEVAIVDRVSKRHMTYGTLIVDLLEAKVVVNNFQNATREEAMTYYMGKYKQQITEALGVWMEDAAHKKALEQIAAEGQAPAKPEAQAETPAQ